MDFGKAFTFMFDDPDWVSKLGIGTLVVLVGMILSPVLIGLAAVFVVMGYGLDVVRNVMDGKQYPLPEWEDWGGFLVRGLKLFGVFLIWALPFIVPLIPLGIGSAMAGSESEVANIFGGLFIACGACLSVLYGLFLLLISPAIYIRLARTDRFAAAFDVAKLWAITRDNLANVIIAILLIIVAGVMAAIVAGLGVVAIVIGLLVTVPFASLWSTLVEMHLYGQIGANSVTPIE